MRWEGQAPEPRRQSRFEPLYEPGSYQQMLAEIRARGDVKREAAEVEAKRRWRAMTPEEREALKREAEPEVRPYRLRMTAATYRETWKRATIRLLVRRILSE